MLGDKGMKILHTCFMLLKRKSSLHIIFMLTTTIIHEHSHTYPDQIRWKMSEINYLFFQNKIAQKIKRF